MAIVEDEVRNTSEEENEIEVVVEEDDGEQDSDDSDDDDEDEEALERKVSELEQQVNEEPYNYDLNIELIQALWALTELDRWRAAFDNLQQRSLLKAEHWLLRIQTEETLAHSPESRDQIAELFLQASLDCYSIPIFSEWCTWCLGSGDISEARRQMEEVLRRAGPDPLSGKIFWDAKLELEKSQLEGLSAEDPDYKEQLDRVVWCLEEVVSRPLASGDSAWAEFSERVATARPEPYVDKVKKQHDVAQELLQYLTPYEDRLLTMDNADEKCKVYMEYIDKVKEFSTDDKYSECDINGILKVLYDRATYECLSSEHCYSLLLQWANLTRQASSRSTHSRVVATCRRRAPRRAVFACMLMHRAELDQPEQVQSIFEKALADGMESYKETEQLWLCYLEYSRRRTNFDNEAETDTLRRTFRLAWDSMAETWGEEANDCEIPLYWARLEYKRMNDPKQGKEIFEEIFKYGENKTMSKYWEALIQLESGRVPPLSENKQRDLYKKAIKFVTDYPPAIARLWTDFERDWGVLEQMVDCKEICDAKLKEWRDNYQAMKDKMTGQKNKGKQPQNKKPQKKTDYKNKNDDKKTDVKSKEVSKGKRKSDGSQSGEVKRRKEEKMEVDDRSSSSGVKRTHDRQESDAPDYKRSRTDSTGSEDAGREACTLFVSNLDFKVNEENLRSKLSEYGEIVSMRVKAGVKAFGGSICYCQYTSQQSVEEAIKHDRTPLVGRPMFLSKYSGKKSKPQFKYATAMEKNKLFVKNLPFSYCTKEKLAEVFDKYGKLKDVRIVTFKDGKPKGLAYIDYEDEASAAEAVAKANGLLVGDRNIDVAISAPPPRKDDANAPTLGLAKRETTGGMRRTQLSSFIPSVLQKASASKAASNGSHANGDEKKPMSNSDFRSMLLKK